MSNEFRRIHSAALRIRPDAETFCRPGKHGEARDGLDSSFS
jgi:hypothetical protein